MRAIHHDLKLMFDDVIYSMSKKLGQICTLLELRADSKLFYTIERKSRSIIIGDLVIRNPILNVEQSFLNRNMLLFCDLIDNNIVIGINVKYLFIIESDATLSRNNIELFKHFPKEETIICISCGTPDVFARLCMSKLV